MRFFGRDVGRDLFAAASDKPPEPAHAAVRDGQGQVILQSPTTLRLCRNPTGFVMCSRVSKLIMRSGAESVDFDIFDHWHGSLRLPCPEFFPDGNFVHIDADDPLHGFQVPAP